MTKHNMPLTTTDGAQERRFETPSTLSEPKPTSDWVTPLSSPSFFRIIRAIVASIDRKKQFEIENAARLASKD